MPTQQLTQAMLETIGRPKQSKYEGKPDYRPCLFKLPDGSQKWKSYPVDADELNWLTRGETYQAVISADDFNIIQPAGAAQPAPTPAPAPAPQPQTTAPAMTADQKRAIAQYIQEQSKLFGYCYQQAQAELPDLSEESHRAIATTLYIQASRKFNL